MDFEDRVEAAFGNMMLILCGIVLLILAAAVFKAEPVLVTAFVVSAIVLGSISFGLTYVPDLYRFALEKWRNK